MALCLRITQEAAGVDSKPVLADEDAAETVGGRHLQIAVWTTASLKKRPSPPITRVAPSRALDVVEDRLDEVLDIAGLLEDGDLLAQAGGAGALVGKRCRRDAGGHHRCRSLP